ncbi:MAG: hypothetical protein ACRC2T_10855 [Thermoguttaceae bacterium]
MNLPPLIIWDNNAATWNKYVEDVFAIFYDDFIKTNPKFENCWVRCYTQPTFDCKEGGFWHCVTSDEDHKNNERERLPDLRRCERIRWPRFIIENVKTSDVQIDYWQNIRPSRTGHKKRHLLWLQEEYLIVLEEQPRKDKPMVFYLITTYLTDKEHTTKKLRDERDAFRKTAEAVPPVR